MWISFGVEFKVKDRTPGCMNTAFKVFYLSPADLTSEVVY